MTSNQMSVGYGNHSIDMQIRYVDWFLYDTKKSLKWIDSMSIKGIVE